jgi:hypothetical protein
MSNNWTNKIRRFTTITTKYYGRKILVILTLVALFAGGIFTGVYGIPYAMDWAEYYQSIDEPMRQLTDEWNDSNELRAFVIRIDDKGEAGVGAWVYFDGSALAGETTLERNEDFLSIVQQVVLKLVEEFPGRNVYHVAFANPGTIVLPDGDDAAYLMGGTMVSFGQATISTLRENVLTMELFNMMQTFGVVSYQNATAFVVTYPQRPGYVWPWE